MAMRGPRHPIGSAPWITEERTAALQIAQSEVDEFMFSAKNEIDWLNEHMADIFSENQINVADIFKTPGKLRGKTPRTARKANKGDIRAPLSDVFSSTPKGAPNPFAVSKLTTLHQQQRRQSPTFTVAEDKPTALRKSRSPPPRLATAKAATTKTAKATATQNTKKAVIAAAAKPTKADPSLVDSGYHGSQPRDNTLGDEEDELAGEVSTQPLSQPTRPATPEAAKHKLDTSMAKANTQKAVAAAAAPAMENHTLPLTSSPDGMTGRRSLTQPTADTSFHSAKEEQTRAVTVSAPETEPFLPGEVTENDMSSSPFCPVQSPSSSPVKSAAMASPPKPSAASPTRKPMPVSAASSPLQSTTPACPPPHEHLSAASGSVALAVTTSSYTPLQVPPAVPTPPMASIPAFIAAKQAAIASSLADAEDHESILDEKEMTPTSPQQREQDREQDQEQKHEDSGADPSSPVRPIVRKSSMNFASLPAREPFTSNKSMGVPGTGLSRASHIDPPRASYYNRPTGGKSIGNVWSVEKTDDDENGTTVSSAQATVDSEKVMAADNKTYAQRLHDRISMLGKSQANAPRPSKSLAALAHQQESQYIAQQKPQQQHLSFSPKRTATSVAAPGAFPEDEDEEEDDDDDDWIVPPAAAASTSPRLEMAKSLALANAKEETVVALPKQRQQDVSQPGSPKRIHAPVIPERTTSAITGHLKSASVPSLAIADSALFAAAKPISVSNPAMPTNPVLSTVSQLDDRPLTPSKSPSRNYRDSPLKHVKNKLSSILKTSKGLLASSAALSAEGKSSLLSPSSTRVGLFAGPSTETLAIKFHNDNSSELTRPDLSRQTSAATTASAASATSTSSATSAASGTQDIMSTRESPVRSGSPTRPNRKTRASAERERRELKQRDKEQKEVQRMAEQMGKLEKMREKEREKAHAFVEEQEKTATFAATTTVQRPIQPSAQRELRGHKQQQPWREEEEVGDKAEEDQDVETTALPSLPRLKPQSSSPIRAPAKPTRSSPRKARVPQVDTDSDMADAPASMLPPPPPAQGTVSSNSSVPRSAQGPRTIRRPMKPTKEAQSKPKQAPTVIRVNTSSSQHQPQQQSSQFHPSNNALAASLHETLVNPPQSHQLKNKASTTSLHTKPSLQSLKSSVSSNGRPKALELAAKRKEAEEREAQRKRDAKAEIERKRAALQELEEQRKMELQKQREREREQSNAETAAAKKAAVAQQRQAALEKAKQTRAPPPAQRTQPPSETQPPRPQSRLATAAGSTMHRSQDELHRPVNTVLSHTAKAMSKRPLPGVDGGYESQSHGRPVTASGNGGGSNMPSYQHKDAKRIRMSEEFDEDELEMGGHIPRVSSIKGPPVRPSSGFKKDLPSKSVFGNGYSTAPTNVSRDLFKSTVTSQHNHQARTGHPMDMAQVSKAAISFAPAANSTASAVASVAAASGSTATPASQNPHKTPLRPVGMPLAGKSTTKSNAKSVAKSAAKSSPRFPNGDGIELPEIQTDDEDSEEDEHVNVAPWADSPDLRRALMRQETVDPFQVFGPPGPLNMEEVFNKSKDRWHKFRARTSSANWSGADRLTEDDIRKDLAARDKIRREGGWSYDLAGV